MTRQDQTRQDKQTDSSSSRRVSAGHHGGHLTHANALFRRFPNDIGIGEAKVLKVWASCLAEAGGLAALGPCHRQGDIANHCTPDYEAAAIRVGQSTDGQTVCFEGIRNAALQLANRWELCERAN